MTPRGCKFATSPPQVSRAFGLDRDGPSPSTLLMLLIASLAIMGVEGAQLCKAPLVVFGASMTDVGQNAMARPGASVAEFPPFGLDYFHAPASRYSNGRVLSDFISQGLGYGLLRPYLDSVAPNFAHGVNIASSGASARSTCINGSCSSGGAFSLEVQVSQYKSFKARVLRAQSRHHGSLRHLFPTEQGFAEAIHFMQMAHNDYINAFLQSANIDAESLVASVLSAMENSLRELHKQGARKIIVMNVIPLGCTPSFLAAASGPNSPKLDNDSCIANVNGLVRLHNSHLQQLINRLRVELSMKSLVVFDANAIYLDAVRHPLKYGLTDPYKACCGVFEGAVQIPCGSKGMLNGQVVEAGRCSNPAAYISWDGLHPTESFAKRLALGVLSGQYLHPTLSIVQLCTT